MERFVLYLAIAVAVVTTLWHYHKNVWERKDVSRWRKLGSLVVHFVHDIVVGWVLFSIAALFVYTVWLNRPNIRWLMMLNILYLIIVIQFLFFRMCSFTILYNWVLNQDKCVPYHGPIGTIRRLLSGKYNNSRKWSNPVKKFDMGKQCNENTTWWIESNQITAIALLVVNVVHFVKYQWS